MSALPDVPTVEEAGLKGYQLVSWHGVFAPAKTPEPVIARLERELVAAHHVRIGRPLAPQPPGQRPRDAEISDGLAAVSHGAALSSCWSDTIGARAPSRQQD